jgi:hypothetical protein
MRVLLTVRSMDVADAGGGSGRWWQQDPSLLARFWRCLDGQTLLQDFQYVVRPGTRRPRRLDAVDQLATQSAAWREGHGWLSATSELTRDAFLDVELLQSQLVFTLGFGGPYLDRRRGTLLDQYVDAVRCLHRDLPAEVVFGPTLRVEVLDLPYARPRPPRLHQHFGHGDLVDFFCLDFHRRRTWGRLDEVERLLAAPLPAGVTRQDDGDLAIVRWIDTLEDEAEVARRLSLQDQWLTQVLQPPIAPWFDEQGDYRVMSFPGPRDALLTSYAPENGTGYLAVADSPNDQAQLDQALGWFAEKRLPDGRPLNGLYVVAPDRETAVRLHDRVEAHGVAGVYYSKPDGSWWDPFPPGPWIEEAAQP